MSRSDDLRSLSRLLRFEVEGAERRGESTVVLGRKCGTGERTGIQLWTAAQLLSPRNVEAALWSAGGIVADLGSRSEWIRNGVQVIARLIERSGDE